MVVTNVNERHQLHIQIIYIIVTDYHQVGCSDAKL